MSAAIKILLCTLNPVKVAHFLFHPCMAFGMCEMYHSIQYCFDTGRGSL